MKNEGVDILLATCNGFSFIASQLDSILAQDYKAIRLLIRDDVSQDSTRKILETYANRFPEIITLLPSGQRLGVKGNFSCLMEHSKANYIMFADQDDIWEHNKISKTFEKMKEVEKEYANDTPLLVHTDLKVVDRDLNLLSSSFWEYNHNHPIQAQTLNRLLMQNSVTGCTMMINRHLLKLALPIPECSAMHDWWLALVSAAFGRIEALPEPTILYRQHGNNNLGAQKFWSIHYFKQGINKICKPEIAKQAQANELLLRYSQRLNQEQKKMLKAYKKLSQAYLLQRIYLIFQHRFFKQGLIRNIINILFKKQF